VTGVDARSHSCERGNRLGGISRFAALLVSVVKRALAKRVRRRSRVASPENLSQPTPIPALASRRRAPRSAARPMLLMRT
jgi:hypothetical protein